MLTIILRGDFSALASISFNRGDLMFASSLVSFGLYSALIPRRLALLSAQAGFLRLIAPPYPSPLVDVSLLYLRDRLAEPAVRWMRDLVADVAAEASTA